MTTIAAVQSAFPAYRYPQAEFAQKVADQVGLDPVQRARLERLHGNAGVDTRHTILPMAEYGALGGIRPPTIGISRRPPTSGSRRCVVPWPRPGSPPATWTC